MSDENEVLKMALEMSSEMGEKYLEKFNNLLLKHKTLAEKSLEKEINLLNAMKNFVNDGSNKKIDSTINMLTLLNVAKTINKDVNGVLYSSGNESNEDFDSDGEDSCIHEDGIYDYCISPKDIVSTSKNTTMPTLMLLLACYKSKYV